MKKGISLYVGASDSFSLEVWRQPWGRWLIYTAYSIYWEMYRLPGYKALDNFTYWVKRKWHRKKGADYLLWECHPWSVNQDLRLADLEQRKREVIIGASLTKEQFKKLQE